jgi:hypothetical protein
MGLAWISTIYLFALLLALIVGASWDEGNDQQVGLGDVIFGPVLFAAIISVWLQLQQWLGVGQDGTLDIWVATGSSSRPSANLGQPNHLATLLLWGIVSVWWWKWKKKLLESSVWIISFFLSFGIALTQSRTGVLSFICLVAALCFWSPLHRLWGGGAVAKRYAAGLAIFYFGSFALIKAISSSLMLLDGPTSIERLSREVRPIVWKMLLEAAFTKPWLGFGWNTVIPAQLLEAEKYPSLYTAFHQAHNFFIDLIVWLGIPLGVFIGGVIAFWMLRVFWKIDSEPYALKFLLLLIIGVHSMLEYPLHYAYFLVPTALMAGAIDSGVAGANRIRKIRVKKEIVIVALLGGFFVFWITVRDYLRAEAAFTSLQFEDAGIRARGATKAPDLLALNQLREIFDFRTMEPRENMSDAEVLHARKILEIYPSPRNFMTLAAIYGLNKRPDEAVSILKKMCKFVSKEQCGAAKNNWIRLQARNSSVKNIEWPN